MARSKGTAKRSKKSGSAPAAGNPGEATGVTGCEATGTAGEAQSESNDNVSLNLPTDPEESSSEDSEEDDETNEPMAGWVAERTTPETPREAELRHMRRLFKSLGFSDGTARYVTEIELVDQASVLKDVNYDQCEQIVKNTRKQIPPTSKKPMTVADRAMRNFQLAVTVAKHYARTSRTFTPRDFDIDLFPTFKAQKGIEDLQRKDKPELPTGLTLNNSPKAAKPHTSLAGNY